jgi:peptidoglycan/xylan/chitin deacetylase (PgdA/CDA1 family)
MRDVKLIVTTSWDDVTVLDLKLLDLLDKYKLKGSFYVIGKLVGKRVSEDQLRHISETHEIGAHTMKHVTLTRVSNEEAKKEIKESKRFLEKIIENEVTSFAYPKGKYNKKHVKMVKDAGFVCARTIEPFYFEAAGDPYEIPVSLWAFPHKFRDLNAIRRLIKNFPFIAVNPLLIKNWNTLGKEIFDVLIEQGGIFHVFGHAWQVNEIEGWTKLEDLFCHMAFQKKAIYTTLTEYVKMHFRNCTTR